MRELRRKVGRRKQVQTAILGALVTFGGCSEPTAQERRALNVQLRTWQADREYRLKLLQKIRKGDRAMPSERPAMRWYRGRS
jgi:hypothetical protein